MEGFESAYGLELLATVHWAATKSDAGPGLDAVTPEVQQWNRRKHRMFTAEHIEVAWRHLRNEGWLTPSPATPIESAA